MANDIDHALKGKALLVLRDERAMGTLSPGEQIAVAFILDRPDLFPRDYSLLDAVEQLGPGWTAAALRVQRAGLQCEESAHG